MTGHVAPQGPSWYTHPQHVDVPIEEIVKGPYTEEVGVRIKIDGFTKTAVVPSDSVDEVKKIVKGTIIGETGGGKLVLVVLPPSSLGRTMLEMDRSLLDQLVIG